MAENEERSVWEPFHVQKGHKREESVVSLFRGWNLLNSTGAAAQAFLGRRGQAPDAGAPPAVLCRHFDSGSHVGQASERNEGFQTPLDVGQWISENVKMTARQFWKNDIIDMLVTPLALSGVQPYAAWKQLPDDALIAPYHRPEKVSILVVGGETSPLWKVSDLGYSVSYRSTSGGPKRLMESAAIIRRKKPSMRTKHPAARFDAGTELEAVIEDCGLWRRTAGFARAYRVHAAA